MCGVIGIWNFRSKRPVKQELLEHARDLMRHRGPDAAGSWVDRDLGFGHRRLSILDLSENGRQPMLSASGKQVITYNGEIYNYKELGQEHLRDVQLCSTSDTEVLVNLFEKYGPQALTYCNGMFAGGAWDRDAETLILFRDRAGIKPLYYTFTEHGIAFASELKSLLTLPGCDRRLNEAAVTTYMRYGYVPGESTLFAHIKKLLPGTYMTLTRAAVKVDRYWTLSFKEEQDRGLAAYHEEFSALFTDAIRLRLRSDVPLGIFLSGGLDSSSVVAQLSRFDTRQLKTFSVAYDYGKDYDETAYARIVSERFRTEHHEVRMTAQAFRDWIPSYVWHMDEPVTEAAAISLHYLSELTKREVTVVLSGEGADELLAGYDIYKYMLHLGRYRALPRALRAGVLEPMLRALGHAKINKYLELAQAPIDQSYAGVSLYQPSRIEEVLAEPLRSFAPADDFASACDSEIHPLNYMLSRDTGSWLVDNLLTKADKMTMASALELRVPFLDYRMLEFCARLPTKYKVRSGEKKFLLKHCMKGLLPKTILQRKKVGFPTPLEAMFRGELFDYVREMVTSRTFIERGLFDGSVAARWLDDHRDRRGDYHRELWQLVVLEQWFRTFVDGHALHQDP